MRLDVLAVSASTRLINYIVFLTFTKSTRVFEDIKIRASFRQLIA